VARDRQRAKQRKQRQAPQPSSRTDEGNGHAQTGDGVDPDGVAPEHVSPEVDHIHRANVPGAWEHGGEVDRFEAELVAGADGEVADPDAAERASTAADDLGDDVRTPGGDVEDRADERADRSSGAAPPPTGGAVTASGAGDPARGKGGLRFWNFVKACWAELQRVQWPDRRQVGQATMVVLGFLVIAGAFLGLADFVAERVVDLII
jgi:preprotein translocase SecE subunit